MCGENSHPEDSANGFQPTCENPEVGISPVETELCVCNDGFILSDRKCVLKSECGCKVGPEYFPVSLKFNKSIVYS